MAGVESATKLIKDLQISDQPNCNFRTISLFPSTDELVNNMKYPLKPNVVFGKYRSVRSYLDIHFKLLREDFINPIREDLRVFLNNHTGRLSNIKIHEIQFIRHGVKHENICHCVELVRSVTDNIHSLNKNSKRFMTGALVLFTKDNFKNTFCGKVEAVDQLKYQKILVSLESEICPNTKRKYLMVEVNIFFEPYYHVLKVLQSMPSIDFPMQEYIINVSTGTTLPKYLNGIKRLVSDPSLNTSQISAINGVLSKEFAIIQGPPGTGKTFIGLKIIKLLLQNYSQWWSHGPLLVISYTNHALDQFLEGLLDTTERLLRLGSQSKSEVMKEYSISRMRKKFPNNEIANREIGLHYKRFRNIESKIKSIGVQLDNINTSRPSCVFQLSLLAKISDIKGWFVDNENRNEFIVWLLEDDTSIKSNNNNDPDSVSDDQTDVKMLRKVIRLVSKLVKNSSKYCMISTSILKTAAESIQKVIAAHEHENEQVFAEQQIQFFKEVYECLLKKIDYLKICLTQQEDKNINLMPYYSAEPFEIPVKIRWKLYKSWLKTYKIHLTTKLDTLLESYKPVYEEFNKLSTEDTLKMMKQMKVIGMTTTCAARMRNTLEALESPIVIVEEAAEVLEAHIISVLTKHCQHLILIGDHQQLKPATSDYEIETVYKLGISLFERMVRNNIPYHTLNVQHRMRPEISQLITPAIYRQLSDHESVTKYPNVRGVKKNVFFVDHTQPETSAGESSKANIHESKFLIQLAIFLLNKSYTADNITILAAYLGQVNAIIKERNSSNNELVKKVAVKSVDDFQGEENKIILLTLVRNNLNSNIGFLSIKNRVCVALSRAREGLYIMGNMTQLASNSKLWESIKKTLESQNGIGKYLPLKCEGHEGIHPMKKTEDFQQGCEKVCDAKLKCDHKCKLLCHMDDHNDYKCHKTARTVCQLHQTICGRLCYQTCVEKEKVN